jgi:hypothetical protein
MRSHPSSEATALLRAWSDGDESALDKLMPLVYEELRRLARCYLRRERVDHTLQATALVNEAYLRLIEVNRVAESRPLFRRGRSADAACARRVCEAPPPAETGRRHDARPA